MNQRLGCPAERTIRLLEGRWRPMVIHWLLQGTMRFNELQRALGAITHRTLSRTLKDMEADGLLQRFDHGEIPPRVEYRLTPRGRSLEPVLIAMHEWASRHPSDWRRPATIPAGAASFAPDR